MRRSVYLWLLTALTLQATAGNAPADNSDKASYTNDTGLFGKLSPRLRQMAFRQMADGHQNTPDTKAQARRATTDHRRTTVFIKMGHGDEETWRELMARHDCRPLSHFGPLYIASLPVGQLTGMARQTAVERMEAGPSCTALMDTTSLIVDAAPIHEGTGLPQAFTGKGTVVGIVDIGFDLTHPTFYSRDMKRYRIRCLWDQLSTDTVGSEMPVGRSYDDEQDIINLQHTQDGLIVTHGTHTLGIAAGSGYDTPYSGVAYESDICAVANAVSTNAGVIDPDDLDQYTTATDALAFQYIFDYAASVGKPCVISFSEGGQADLDNSNRLYREYLDSLTGPGRIIVASAGNEGLYHKHLHKPAGTRRGTFLQPSGKEAGFTLRTSAPIDIRTVIYGKERNDTLVTSVPYPYENTGYDDYSVTEDSVITAQGLYRLEFYRYQSCFDKNDEACEYVLTLPDSWTDAPISIELTGDEADCDAFALTGTFGNDDANPLLNHADRERSILCPGDAPSVICVGATAHRKGLVNQRGEWTEDDEGEDGVAVFSSIGPTIDGRTKPDVMAPGVHVVSSYNSFYMDNHPNSYDLQWDIAHSSFQGRTYTWNADNGTSMSTPVVAGIIALWLEANPTLTPSDIMDIISKTSRKVGPGDVFPNNRCGYGEIDAYKGLLSVLKFTDIKELPTQQSRVAVSSDGNRLIVEMPGDDCPALELTLYSLGGTVAAQYRMAGGQRQYTFPLPPLPSGIYAARITGDRRMAGSRLIRL